MPTLTPTPLIDSFGRHIDYVRLSVTDRCDFRCTYCMAEEMTFLPRREVLSLEEIGRVAKIFLGLGVSKLRVTGGEPLIRRGIHTLLEDIGAIPGLKELAITTNASQLKHSAQTLRKAGVNSLNISLDTLDPAKFRAITRVGDLDTVLAGIEAALDEGFERIRLNAVILRGQNDDDVIPLTEYAIAKGINIAFIEEMPLGQVNAAGKPLEFVASSEIQTALDQYFTLIAEEAPAHAGPARYWFVSGTKTRVGLISPHTNNFCSSCNRLRVTAEGRLLLCLGNEHSISLRDHLRAGDSDDELAARIHNALTMKPERHVFDQPNEPQILRFMNASGG
ncbi:MAG: hypothetical protein RLZZ602_1779 [Pseudomonadota bacterium]